MLRIFIVAVAAAMLWAPAVLMAAQQDGHTMPGMSQAGQATGSRLVAACVASQQQVTVAADAANRRIEFARQTNQPAAMRAAIDDLQGVLSSIRAQLAPCAELQALAAADPQAGHAMPSTAQVPTAAPGAPVTRPGSTAPAPAAAAPAAPMDHSKMPMAGNASAGNPAAAVGPKATPAAPMDHSKMPTGGSAPVGKPGTATGRKPAAPAAPMDHSKMPMGGTPAAKQGAAAGAKPAPPTAAMDHSKMPMGGEAQPGKVMDPVNGLMVDPATAPKTTYQGQTYYFSSEQSQKEFLENPEKFAKKPKG